MSEETYRLIELFKQHRIATGFANPTEFAEKGFPAADTDKEPLKNRQPVFDSALDIYHRYKNPLRKRKGQDVPPKPKVRWQPPTRFAIRSYEIADPDQWRRPGSIMFLGLVFSFAEHNPEFRFQDLLELLTAYRDTPQGEDRHPGVSRPLALGAIYLAADIERKHGSVFTLEQANQLLEEMGGQRLTHAEIMRDFQFLRRDEQSPFKGLSSYKSDDAALFVELGEGEDSAIIYDKVCERRAFMVIGASGSGKSSLVNAAVVPKFFDDFSNVVEIQVRLIEGQNIREALWRGIEGSLREHHAYELELLRGKLSDHLKKLEESSVINAILPFPIEFIRIWITVFPQTIWVIDQLEELYTSPTITEEDQTWFTDFLLALHKLPTLKDDNQSKNKHIAFILASIRSDMMSYMQRLSPRLVNLFQNPHLLPDAPTLAALEEHIKKLCERANVGIEDRLIWILIEDMEKAHSVPGSKARQAKKDNPDRIFPGLLPLVSFTLERLYQEAAGGELTAELYDNFRLTGLMEDICIHVMAESGLTPVRIDQLIPHVFKHLVTVSDPCGENVPVRRQGRWDAIIGSNQKGIEKFLNALLKARLLRSFTLPDEETVYVEVTHEALFTLWPQLKQWIDQYLFHLSVFCRLQDDAEEWEADRFNPGQERVLRYELAKYYRQTLGFLQDKTSHLIDDGALEVIEDYLNSEVESMLAELEDPETSHESRADIGARLGFIIDPRPGIAPIKAYKDIKWVRFSGQVLGTGEQGFRISQVPVTVGQWQAFREAEDGYSNPDWWANLVSDGKPINQRLKANYPAHEVNWYEAVAFTRWLNAQLYLDQLPFDVESLTREMLYNFQAIRLPLRAEWEIAAEGAYATMGNTLESGLNRLVPVGLYPLTRLEVPLDMCGNTAEWCLDGDNDQQPLIQLSSLSYRRRMGHSFKDKVSFASQYLPMTDSPLKREKHIGFRLVLPIL